LSNCSSTAALHRYTARHNEVLSILLLWLKAVLPSAATLFSDLPDSPYLQVRDLFLSFRPDIAVQLGPTIHILELTVCHETNLLKSHDYKKKKYAFLHQDLSTMGTGKLLTTSFLEVSVLGFLSDISDFVACLKIPPMTADVVHKIRKSVTDSSFQVYCNRNNNIIPH